MRSSYFVWGSEFRPSYLLCDILTDSVPEDDLREILNSSNKRCRKVYKQTKWPDDRHD